MKLTTRCGAAAIDGLNQALLAEAVEAKVLRTNRLRVDTTVARRTLPTPPIRVYLGQFALVALFPCSRGRR